MKTLAQKIAVVAFLGLALTACKKSEKYESTTTDAPAAVAEIQASDESNNANAKMVTSDDKVSSAASTQVKGREFVKTAAVSMEVKDVYDATIKIENQLAQIGGFVIHSELQNSVLSNETYNQSDDKAMQVRKSKMSNQMTVKVPTLQLADFLQKVSDEKIFLNSRVINAEDVTANIKMAQLEQQRINKKDQHISNIKQNSTTVEQSDENERDRNQTTIDSFNLKDNIAYSTVNLDLVEPSVRISEIPVVNSKSVDAKYKTNFFYEAKLSLINGFYLIQQFFILLLNLWPFAIILTALIWFIRTKGVKRTKTTTPPAND